MTAQIADDGLQDYINELVSAAPPLTDDQRHLLTVLLRPGPDKKRDAA